MPTKPNPYRPQWFDSIGGRRYFLCFFIVVTTTLLVIFNKVTGDVFATVVIATSGAYIAGNVTQRATEKK